MIYKYYVEFYNEKTEAWEWIFRTNSLRKAKKTFKDLIIDYLDCNVRLIEVIEKKY